MKGFLPNALLLAGGHSRRMHCDKATLLYNGRSQLTRTMELLGKFCPSIHLSLRAEQKAPPQEMDVPIVKDAFGEIGPMGGILSAFAAHPGNAWLVVACDLPFLGENTVRHLLSERDTHCSATAYRSAHDGLPEPLCAIYEPRAFQELRRFKEETGHCPRKFLMEADVKLLDPIDLQALDNVNTTEEYNEATMHLTTATKDQQNGTN
ncbi:MAG: NTP transferase domain-containing protein [Opitutales bacterium]|jgi:molybdenum cofactor guanylyltransferase